MKIGLVLAGFSADERDWCIPALLNLVRRLAFDHQVHVFALEYPYRRSVYSVYGAQVHSLGGRNRGKWYAPRLWSDVLAAIFAEHRRQRFDILHAFWVNEPSAVAVSAGRILKVPVIASAAGGELVAISRIGYGGQLDRVERIVVRMVLRAADRVTVGSRYLQQLAARWRPDADWLPLGVDTQRFAPCGKGEPNALPTILNVGSLVKVKQQMQLLDAFAQWGSQDARLEIIGHGTLERELRDRARALKIADRVAFLGEIPHSELAPRYRRAALVVQSSLHEAQGMAVLEAAACGTALAGTPVGVLPELAEAGGAVPSRGFGADDLAEAMARAMEDCASLGERAWRAVEQGFSLEETMNRWLELYRQIRRG